MDSTREQGTMPSLPYLGRAASVGYGAQQATEYIPVGGVPTRMVHSVPAIHNAKWGLNFEILLLRAKNKQAHDLYISAAYGGETAHQHPGFENLNAAHHEN